MIKFRIGPNQEYFKFREKLEPGWIEKMTDRQVGIKVEFYGGEEYRPVFHTPVLERKFTLVAYNFYPQYQTGQFHHEVFDLAKLEIDTYKLHEKRVLGGIVKQAYYYPWVDSVDDDCILSLEQLVEKLGPGSRVIRQIIAYSWPEHLSSFFEDSFLKLGLIRYL